MKMLRRFGFRWSLAVLFTSVHVVLLVVSLLSHHRLVQRPQEDSYRSAALQEGVGSFVPQEPPLLSGPMKAALCINLPAAAIAVLVTAPFKLQDTALMGVTTVFVAPLWFFIGSWFDVRLGLKYRRVRDSGGRRFLRKIAAGVSVVLLFVMIQVFFRGQGGDPSGGVAILIWSSLLAALAIANVFWRPATAYAT